MIRPFIRQRFQPTIRVTLILAAWPAIALSQAQSGSSLAPPAATASLPADQRPAADQRPLADQIASLLAAPNLARDHWGIVVTSLDGTPLYSLNEAQLFLPASNAKLFTTAAALALLGPDQRFTTRVEYGAVGEHAETVQGNVVIVGAGDGDLNNRELPYQGPSASKTSSPAAAPALRYLAEFADQIAANGVKHIRGDIVGDDTVFPWEPYPEDWAIDDAVWGYGAPVSGLSVNDNQVLVTIHPGKTTAERPTVVWPAGVPAYYMLDATGLATGPAKSENHIEIYREAGSKTLQVYGVIAADAEADAEEVAISDPAEFAAQALKRLLAARGIQVDGIARAQHRTSAQSPGFLAESHRPLASLFATTSPRSSSLGAVCQDVCPVILEHTSPPVVEDVVLTNKISQNLHAELLLHHLAKQYGQANRGSNGGGDGGVDGSTAEGVRVVRQFLLNAGLDPDDFVFFDGGGVSGHDLVTPRAVARLLEYATTQPWFPAWKGSLPIGGVDGTLAGRFTQSPLRGHVFAKTGTHSEARALSGYLDAASGRSVIFSILVGNHLPGTHDDEAAMDRIVAAIQAAE